MPELDEDEALELPEVAVVVLEDILERVHLDMRALVHLVALVGLDNITQVLME